MNQLIVCSFLFLITIPCLAQLKGDEITGTWLTSGKEPAKIQIYNSGGKFSGKITWLKNPTENGKPRVDAKNPERSRRSQPIIGLVILSGFVFKNNEWTDGTIYDPESGKNYSCNISLKGKTLKVRGYVGLSLFGRTETWTRVTD